MKLILFAYLFLFSCSNSDDNVICTEQIVMVNVSVVDQNGKSLDSFTSKSLDENQNEFDLDINNQISGNYIVMSDRFHNDLGSNDKIYFQLFDEGLLIHEEIYYISGGECHISKKFGPDSIVIQNQ